MKPILLSWKEFSYFSGVLIIAFLIRFPYLDLFPPLGIIPLYLRIITASMAVISILLTMLVVRRYSNSLYVSVMTGLSMTLMPWHIEQSRIYSEVVFGLVTVLTVIFFWSVARCKKCKFMLIVTAAIIFYRVYPSFWIFHLPYASSAFSTALSNIFKLSSVEFLFYSNDSFWWGGLRTVGALLPFSIPIFFVGVTKILQSGKYRMSLLLCCGGIYIVAALAPLFPEDRTFFLLTPIIAYICARGIVQITYWYKMHNLLVKGILCLYIMLLSYEHLLFFHFYTSHYSQRIIHEVPYEQRNF